MASSLDALKARVESLLGDHLESATIDRGELTIVCSASSIAVSCQLLRDQAGFDQCIDLCGMDYSTYRDGLHDGPRFAVVLHLMSVQNNQRLRVRFFAPDDDFPVVPSLIDVWASVNWYEREAFDMYGIVFEGHPDLRRILTDYGFVGHPFRKDFPVSGHVEMRYDPTEGRVIYQPVTIEPREITPRIIREENYGG
ncbi:NADH-quinone oxidoreductase subunit C [Laribacter hongkongensis]|uniref:NADH-quinone oxidoreductase subunit C n=1 Tax=Laribacter hongkongensis TaxID=168471 RepID=UPI00187768FC|nr:NADH-quinone oxidoreductase subunit C [Laribacter hongkongensis]MBE5527326.1 NADH-quinone oxidoreductase subunit C [Laribacter hongkongensis]MCG8995915.1 NADH-quinone oxidoreductase subunit C [Laribacter hongkongensis]MCG9011329.1 NADH-quinone oxidoreductase subunit C [Laribacter hongkongensis]MCG9022706.1 NADH-quinone oxidoreductase subunit C [Laribacter hongkongensis]MCG9030527.1 NADH-quinone oxidoreductase subunit C [Laribacter hongkongensis]